MIVPPDEPLGEWGTLDLDAKTLRGLSPNRVLDLLANHSPDVSRAVWDFLRMCNPGYEILALRPGTDTPVPAGNAVLGEFTALMDRLYGGFDVVIGRLHFAAFLRGALFAELVLDGDSTGVIDFATPDPATVRFRRANDTLRGPIWELGQLGPEGFLPLNRPTIRYTPIDPAPGSPYGRSLVAPALFSTLFLQGLLIDLRRVVAQQGWPRLDISILVENLRAGVPPGTRNDPVKFKEWVDKTITDVQTAYAKLQPSDAYIHTDSIVLNRPVGTVDATSLGAIDGIIRALERLSLRALKTMPLLMGSSDTSSESNANRQWEVYAAGIKSIQHSSENQISALLSLLLQAAGIPAVAQIRFAELRASEMLRDAQTAMIRIRVLLLEYFLGLRDFASINHDLHGKLPVLDAPLDIDRAMMLLGKTAGPASGGGASDNPGGSPETHPPATAHTRDLPPLPETVEYTDDEQRALPDLWDATAPDEDAGLLDATVPEAHTNGNGNGSLGALGELLVVARPRRKRIEYDEQGRPSAIIEDSPEPESALVRDFIARAISPRSRRVEHNANGQISALIEESENGHGA